MCMTPDVMMDKLPVLSLDLTQQLKVRARVPNPSLSRPCVPAVAQRTMTACWLARLQHGVRCRCEGFWQV